jgi:hypothetical protein
MGQGSAAGWAGGFVKGWRSSGYFAISNLDGQLIAPAISYRRLRLIGRADTLLAERRKAASSPDWKSGFSPPKFYEGGAGFDNSGQTW